MALRFKRTVGGVGRKLEQVQLANTQTVAVGDVIETYTTGKGTLQVAAKLVGGIVDSICDKDGLPFKSTNPVAGTASGTDTTSVVTGTAGLYYALVDFSPLTIYSATVNGTMNTTVSSNLRGAHFDIDSANTTYGRILESTGTRTQGVEANFYSYGVDPDDSTRMLVSIALSEKQGLTT